MEFIELTIRIPVPSRGWFRFSVKSLLLLMLFVAVMCLACNAYRNRLHALVRQQIENTRIARDNALEDWKLASANLRSGGIARRREEAAFRAQYHELSNTLANLLRRDPTAPTSK